MNVPKILAGMAAPWALGTIIAILLRAVGQLDTTLPITACASPATLFGLAAYATHHFGNDEEQS